MWDYDNNALPSSLMQCFTSSNRIHNPRGELRGNFYPTEVYTSKFGIKAFKYQGVEVLHNLMQKQNYIIYETWNPTYYVTATL